MGKKKEENAIIKTDEGDCELPAWMLGEEYAGAGQEDIDENITPVLHLCQPGSPEVVDGDATFGELFIRGVGQNLGDSTQVVILMTSKEWVLWRHRDDGGGIEFRGTKSEMEGYRSGSTEWSEEGKEKIPPPANETRNFFFIEYDKEKDVVDPNGNGPFICSMSKTSSKTGADMLKAIKMAGGAKNQGKLPIFAMVFELSSEKKKDGDNNWAEYKYRSLGTVKSKESFAALMNLHTQFKAQYGSKVETPEETQAETVAAE